MNCPNCQTEIQKDQKFCSNCGNEVNITNNAPQINEDLNINLLLTCPHCNIQNQISYPSQNNRYGITCKKCNKQYTVSLIKIRSKKSKLIEKRTKRQFEIRYYNANNGEQLLNFIHNANNDFELKSKDIALLYYIKNDLKSITNLTLGVHYEIHSGCYVATYIFSQESNEIITLRYFRDEFLAQYELTRKVISKYYSLSPLLISKLNNKPLLRFILRLAIQFFTWIIDKTLIRKVKKS